MGVLPDRSPDREHGSHGPQPTAECWRMEAISLPPDRAATLQRIDDLRRAPQLDANERALLTFCFRASDHEIYYRAADCLGAWLTRDAELHTWFEGYCSTRGLSVHGPVALDGQRSHRRVLLARCAAAAIDPDQWPPPVDLTAALEIPRRPADMAALLVGLLRIYGQDRFKPKLAPGLDGMLAVLKDDPRALIHPGTLARWAQLWVRRVEDGSPTLERDTLHSVLVSTVAAAASGSVGERVARFTAADALIGAVNTHARDPAHWLDGDGQGDVALWIRQRWLRACLRHGTPAPGLLEASSSSWTMRQEQAALTLAIHSEDPLVLGTDPIAAGEAALLEAIAPRLRRRERWLAMSVGERALCLFLVIDRLGESGPLPMAAGDLLEQGSASFETAPAAATRGAVLLRLVSRLAAWEQLPLAGLLEARRLHATADPALSLLLLPHRDSRSIDTELADGLADLVEQQLRTALATDPQFDADRYLGLALVRHPPPAFAQALLRLLAQRSYQDVAGRNVDLQQQVASWADAVARPDQAEAPWRQLPAFSPPHRAMSAELERLAAWLGVDPGNRPRPDSAAAILQRLHCVSRPLLCGDGSGNLDVAVDDVIAAATRAMRQGLEQGQQLETLALADPDDAQALLQDLGATLETIRRDLERHLPEPDGRALDAAVASIEAHLEQWRAGLALCRTWARKGPSVPIPALPAALLPALFAALERHRAGTVDYRQAALQEGLDLLSALPAGLQDAWLALLARRWCEALELAMEISASSTVRRMLHDPRQAVLAQRPEAAATLATAKRFCFDRLHLGSARHVALLEGRSGLGRCSGGFLLHYSAVWVGLLVGTILMLDFGDAWKAMAEAGDITGITLTGLLGLGGTWAWLLVSQRRRLEPAPGDSILLLWSGLIGRTLGFLLLCASYTLAATGGMWLLLSGTDEVVQGPMAIGHIVVWAGFALFAGTFFGLVAKDV